MLYAGGSGKCVMWICGWREWGTGPLGYLAGHERLGSR